MIIIQFLIIQNRKLPMDVKSDKKGNEWMLSRLLVRCFLGVFEDFLLIYGIKYYSIGIIETFI